MNLNRRAIGLALVCAGLLGSFSAQALTIKAFSQAELMAVQSAGNSVALHFRADWCPTCRAQDKAIETFKNDPALDKVTLLVVDYDNSKALRKAMGVAGQSTIVVFKGKNEVTRSAGDTDAIALKALLLKSL